MKNPRWKSGGILNVVCSYFLGLYGKSLLKYKYHGDTMLFRMSEKKESKISGRHINDKINFDNILRRK